MATQFDEDAFAGSSFADLDTLSSQQLYDLNVRLVGATDTARAEQWRQKIADLLVGRS